MQFMGWLMRFRKPDDFFYPERVLINVAFIVTSILFVVTLMNYLNFVSYHEVVERKIANFFGFSLFFFPICILMTIRGIFGFDKFVSRLERRGVDLENIVLTWWGMTIGLMVAVSIFAYAFLRLI